jgi:hypothetical protein
MIRIEIEVGTDDSCCIVSALASSIREAVGMARARFPDREIRVVYPVNADRFFTEDPRTALTLITVVEEPLTDERDM